MNSSRIFRFGCRATILVAHPQHTGKLPFGPELMAEGEAYPTNFTEKRPPETQDPATPTGRCRVQKPTR
jgi:hypothetical protein